MTSPTPAPRSEALRAVQRRRLGNAGHDATAASEYSTFDSPGISQRHCPRLVTWLRCRSCQRGFFAASAPGPQSCPACAGGRLLPIALWDLAHEADQAGMLWRAEVHHA
jgi:hypothetical protein